ncbi:MAG: GNAT family N-acetyltransferase [Planctomycetia bacterium]|nr:GNAT family N-acetyltransferase [Planctomycetia bacterium]
MEKRDIEESARVLSVAMTENPIHLAVFQNSNENVRIEIENYFKKLLSDKPGIVFIAKANQNIIGVVRMCSCYGKNTINDTEVSIDETNIDWRRDIWINEWSRRDPKDQHWHLGPIGVLPTHQGVGVGSMLMERFCSEVDACMANAYLETDKDVNVVFIRNLDLKLFLSL